jgi:O-antigen/teichoic acid export membrane protein
MARAFGGAVAWNAAGMAASLVIGLVAAMIQTRALGTVAYGQYAYLLWLAEAGGALGALGLARPVRRFVASLKRDLRWKAAASMTSRAAVLAAIWGGVVGLIVAHVPALVPSGWEALALIVPFSISAVAAQNVIASALQGAFGFKDASLANLLSGSVLLAGSVAVALRHAGPLSQFAVSVFAAGASVVYGAFALRRLLRPPSAEGSTTPWRTDGPFVAYWKASAALTIIEMVVWQRSEMFFLNRFTAPEQAAYYNAAFAIAGRLGVVPQLFAPVILATVSGLRYEGEAEVMRRVFGSMTRWLTLLCAPLYLIAAALAPLIARLVFGRTFAGAGLPLAILLAGGLVPAVAVPGSAIIYGTDRMGFALRSGAAAAVVTLVADLTLIPRHGAVGAAFANLSGQIFATAVTFALSLRPTGFGFPWLRILPAALSAGLAALASYGVSVLVGGPAGLMLGAAAGGLGYLVALRALRVLEPSDDRLFAALGDLAPSLRGAILGLGRWLVPRSPAA